MHTLKYFPRLGIYKSSNVTFDPATCQGYSYKWYRLVDKIGNTVVLNTYSYSNTTIRHIYKVRRVLEDLGIQYVGIEAPEGLQNLERAIEHYQNKNGELLSKVNNPRTKKEKNVQRYHELAQNGNKLLLIKQLMELKG